MTHDMVEAMSLMMRREAVIEEESQMRPGQVSYPGLCLRHRHKLATPTSIETANAVIIYRAGITLRSE